MSDMDAQNGLAQAQFMPDVASLGTSPVDAFNAAYDASHRSASNYAQYTGMTEALQDHLDMVKQKTGKDFDNPLADWTHNPSLDVLRNTGQALNELSVKENDPSLAMPDLDTLHQGAIEKARAAQRVEAAQAGGPRGVGANAAEFLGGLAGSATDPESLALNQLGYALIPAAGPLANATLHAAAGFAAGQLADTADTFQYKQAINPEYGFGDVAKEVAAAGVMGAGQQLAGAGFAALWRRFRSASPTVAAAIPQPIQDAGNVAERHADLDAQNPFRAGLQGVQAHRDAITKLESDLAAGKTPELPPSVQEAARASTPTPIENVADRAATHSDPGVQRIGESLTAVSDDWAKMQELAPPMHDITPAISDAVDAIAKAKDEGKPVSEILTQGDTFYSDQAQQAAKLFLKDDGEIAPKAEIEHNLRTYSLMASGQETDVLSAMERSAVSGLPEGIRNEVYGQAAQGGGVETPPVIKGGATTAEPGNVGAGADILGPSTISRANVGREQRAGGAGRAVGEHESGLIRAATTPEEAAKVSTDPAVHDAMMADLQRNIEQGNNRVPVEDEQGNSKLGFADKELADIERQEAAAREIAGCATPAQAAE
jgi:hypothetical protein